MHVDVCSSMSDHMCLCVCICARCVCVYVCLWVHVPCCVKTVTVYSPSPLLAPGMIINPIIKHLLPTAPALSLSLPDPWGRHHTIPGSLRIGREIERERAGGGGLEKGKEGHRLQEGGVEKRAGNPKGNQIEARFFHTGKVFLWGGRCRVKLCDFRTKGEQGKQSDALRGGEEKKRKNRKRGTPQCDNPWSLTVNEKSFHLFICFLPSNP